MNDVKGVEVRVGCTYCKGEKYVRKEGPRPTSEVIAFPVISVMGPTYSPIRCPVCCGSGTEVKTMSVADFRCLMRGEIPVRAASSVKEIQAAVAAYFHIAESGITGKGRHGSITYARHIAMWLARTRLKMSFPELGLAFGRRDHTTVMSAVRKIEHWRSEVPVSRDGDRLKQHLQDIQKVLDGAVKA